MSIIARCVAGSMRGAEASVGGPPGSSASMRTLALLSGRASCHTRLLEGLALGQLDEQARPHLGVEALGRALGAPQDAIALPPDDDD